MISSSLFKFLIVRSWCFSINSLYLFPIESDLSDGCLWSSNTIKSDNYNGVKVFVFIRDIWDIVSSSSLISDIIFIMQDHKNTYDLPFPTQPIVSINPPITNSWRWYWETPWPGTALVSPGSWGEANETITKMIPNFYCITIGLLFGGIYSFWISLPRIDEALAIIWSKEGCLAMLITLVLRRALYFCLRYRRRAPLLIANNK
jgi:hypothetical protein